ncbi:MAG TPA: type IV toxin-antitoxin system AbiEi family antitoxin domain-containing protein [Solirubrobacteraceae bacterium]|nr:type IV toxin-antitoxin system AbiEi family antitoxin domain-containing protein [Solirubrobacteraceae bacterium]
MSRSSDETATYPVAVLGVRRLVAASGSRHERIAQVAARQRGHISRAQLLAIGVPDRTIYRLAARGQLIRVHRGVYAVGHAAPAPLAAETAALLACGPGAVLSHHPAARLRGVLRRDDAPIHVTVPGRHGPRLANVHVHRTSTLTPADIQFREGLPLTSTARTLLDLADVLDQRDLDWAVDEAIQQRLVSLKALHRVAEQADGRHGAARLLRAAQRHRPGGVTKSVAEKRFRALIRAAGLPEPLRNRKLRGVEVDCYWPDSQLVVEVDGYQWHSTRPKFEHDSRKGAKLVAAGLALMRVTWYQMEDESFAVVARVAQAITRAA